MNSESFTFTVCRGLFIGMVVLGCLFCFSEAKVQQAQTTSPDTLKVLPQPPQSDIKGPIKYWAEHIFFSLPKQTTRMEGKVRIEYQNMTLTAGHVLIDWKKNNLIAEGKADSTDSTGNPVYRDLPVLTEKGREPISGIRLEYNFKTQRGKVLEGQTKMEPGYYKGEQIKKVGKETLFIKDGYFTSCEWVDHPHYYFRSSKMRVRINKVAVAKPIVMYIADVPIFGIPFGVIPLQRGRRSGFILPTYGESSYGGRYLEGFGVYLAPSDYWDMTVLANFYERTGMVYRGEFRYKKRYQYDGNINGAFAPRDVTTGQKIRRWNIRFRHYHVFDPTMSLRAEGSFQSDKTFQRDYSTDINQRLNQVLSTNLTFNKKWTESKNSLRVNMRRQENLQTGKVDLELPNLTFTTGSNRALSLIITRSRNPQNGRVDFTLPSISYSQPQKKIIPLKTGQRAAWYNNFLYNYNSQFLSKGYEIKNTLTEPILPETPTSDNPWIPGGLTLYQPGVVTSERVVNTGWRHNLSLRYQTKFLSYLKTNHSLNYSSLIVPRTLQYTWVDSLNRALPDTVKGIRMRHQLNYTLGASTTLYGLWELPLIPLKVIRHKMDPAVSFTFAPDYSRPFWGYIQTFRDSTGRLVKYDRFQGNVFSAGTPTGRTQRMNLSLDNSFQGKWLRDQEEKKVDLFRVRFNTSYDFLADSLRWSDISSNLSATPHRNLRINVQSTHTLYKKGHSGNGKRNEFVWEGKTLALPRTLSWNIEARASVHLQAPQKGVETQRTPAPDTAQVVRELSGLGQGGVIQDITQPGGLEELRGFDLPWDINLDFTYQQGWSVGRGVNRQFEVSVTGRLQLTKNWRIDYSATLDLINRNIDYQRFLIYRDLHCWEMSFEWQPDPNFGYYRLLIRIKESALKDIKLTKTSAGRPPL